MALPEKQGFDGTRAVQGNMRQMAVFLAIGLLAGRLASIIVGGDGLIRYLVTGVLGAFVGGYLFTALRIELPIRNPFLSQVATATAGAILVVLVARLIA